MEHTASRTCAPSRCITRWVARTRHWVRCRCRAEEASLSEKYVRLAHMSKVRRARRPKELNALPDTGNDAVRWLLLFGCDLLHLFGSTAVMRGSSGPHHTHVTHAKFRFAKLACLSRYGAWGMEGSSQVMSATALARRCTGRMTNLRHASGCRDLKISWVCFSSSSPSWSNRRVLTVCVQCTCFLSQVLVRTALDALASFVLACTDGAALEIGWQRRIVGRLPITGTVEVIPWS